MKRTLVFLLALFLVSCSPDDGLTSNGPATTEWAPRLTYASGATVPKVDRIRLVITLADGRGTVLEREADWSQGKVVVDGIPVGVSFDAVVRGELSDGSLVWSGSSQVGGGSGEVAIASQVTVTSPLGIQLALDEAALQSPASGNFPRVSLKGWPYADTAIHVLYTLDGSVPSSGNGSTREYAGPFTLQGNGTLSMRAVEAETASALVSSQVLTYRYAGANPSTCNVPGFQPSPGVVQANGVVNVALEGTSNCQLRYRTDGQDPTATDPFWPFGSVWLSPGKTNLKLRAFPTAAGMNSASPVMEGSWSCPACVQPEASIQAVGSTEVSVASGMSLGLSVTVAGANASDVAWSIDSGSAYGSVTGYGATAQVYGGAAGTGTMRVKAALPVGPSVVFRVTVNGTGTSLVASGSTQLAVAAGSLVQLSTIVTGADPSQVNWMIESGNALLVFESGTTGASASLRASSSATSGSAVVRATLGGMSVYFNLTFTGTAASGTIMASGDTQISLDAGASTLLSTVVTGADVSQVNWTVETGSTLLFFPEAISGSTAKVKAYAIGGSGVMGTATVRASLPNGNSVLFVVTVNGKAPDTSFTASGDTSITLSASSYAWVYTNLTGGNGSDVVWSVDNGSTSVSVTPSGSMATINSSRILANSRTVDTVHVRAKLGSSDRQVVFRVIVTGGEPLGFAVSGTTTLSLEAGGSLSLFTTTTGKLNPSVAWSVVEGGGTVTAGSPTTGCTYTAPASVSTATDVHVKGVLEGTALEVHYFITVSARPALEIVDSTGVVRDEYAPERRTAKFFQARRGSTAVTGTWSVVQSPSGSTSNLYADGMGMRFKPNMTGSYRLVVTEGGDADSVTVRWPDPPSIAFGGDSLLVGEEGEYVNMYPKVFPSDEPLTWKLNGSASGTINPSSYYNNGATVAYAYYQSSSLNGADSIDASISAAMTGDASKSLTYRIRIYPRRLTVRDGNGTADTVFTVTDTAQGLNLGVWRKGALVAGSPWFMAGQPSGNGGVLGEQSNGVLMFHPAVAGTYRLQAYWDGMYSPEIRVIWGSASP